MLQKFGFNLSSVVSELLQTTHVNSQPDLEETEHCFGPNYTRTANTMLLHFITECWPLSHTWSAPNYTCIIHRPDLQTANFKTTAATYDFRKPLIIQYRTWDELIMRGLNARSASGGLLITWYSRQVFLFLSGGLRLSCNLDYVSQNRVRARGLTFYTFSPA